MDVVDMYIHYIFYIIYNMHVQCMYMAIYMYAYIYNRDMKLYYSEVYIKIITCYNCIAFKSL